MPIKTLLVEDSPADARIVQELLRKAGGRQITLTYADRISTAFQKLDSEKPDVLILDLSLPDSKGLATFRQVHAKAAAVPIIVLTGLDDLDVAVESIAEGAADYLLKNDLSAGLLVRVLRYSIERKRINEGLRRTESELAFKNRIASTFLTALDEDLAAGVLGAMLEYLQSEKGVFGYIDENGALICPAGAQGGLAGKTLSQGGTFPPESWCGIWGRALREKRAFLLNQACREFGIAARRALVVPLLDRDDLVGLFEVMNKPIDYGAEDREFLERAAAYSAPILHARLQRDAHEKAISAALAAKEVLLQEVHHRVKNNLQIISSLLNMHADALPDEARRAIEESQRRVRSMALVHEQLYSRERPDELDFADYAASLATEILAAFSVHAGAIGLRFELEPVVLGIDQAVPCALILNELLTNSVKYAFPDGRTGEILIGLQQEQNRITLRVADNGIGFPPGFDRAQSPSLGLRIVDILTFQLNGTLQRTPATGADFILTFARQSAERAAEKGT